MSTGDRVRLKNDPSRIGILMDHRRRQLSRELVLVRFTNPNRDQWIPIDQLEVVPSDETPLDLLQKKQYGTSSDLRRTITHVRLTGRLADVIYSMEATNTDFYAYQFKPVLKLLLSPSNGILIADEVGLGKTIEAGLIWTELRSRFDMNRLLVLCPAMLREKWQEELERRMGVRAEIVDAGQLIKALSKPDIAKRGFAYIASHQGTRPPKGWDDEDAKKTSDNAKLARFLQERENDESLVDLLVVDEAHYLRNPETKTHQLGYLFRQVAEYACFLSATPVHNKNQDLFALLNLLDPETFRRLDDFQYILQANAPLVEARDLALSPAPDSERLRELLLSASRHHLLKGSRQLAYLLDFLGTADLSQPENRSHLAYRLETVNLLGHTVTRTRKREVKELRVVRDPIDEPVTMSAPEERFYSSVTELVASYGFDRDINEGFLLATPQRLLTSSMPAAYRSWQGRLSEFDDELAQADDDENPPEMGPLTEYLARGSREIVSLDELIANDTKYSRLRGKMLEFFDLHPKEKIVLFSTFKATLTYLAGRLEKDGISTITLKGGTNHKQSKDDVIRAFRRPDGPQVLLSSEVGGEGIDLQFCWVLVNYDLPWNPMRVEQRIGRLDRIGQLADMILIWNLFYEETIDARIYRCLYTKLDLCRQALGDFEAILGDQIRSLTSDLLKGHLTPEQQIKRIDQTAVALETLRLQEEELEKGASQFVALGDYILSQIHSARDLHRWIHDRDLRVYVLDHLRQTYPGGIYQQLGVDSSDYEITLSTEAKHALETFIKYRGLTGSTALVRPGSAPIRCRFVNKVSGAGHEKMEIISQFHPLVRFVSDDIEARGLKLRPVVAVSISSDSAPSFVTSGTYLVAGTLWSVSGLQSTEKLVYMGKSLIGSCCTLSETVAEQLAAYAAMNGVDWPQARTQVDVEMAYDVANNELFAELSFRYEEYISEIQAQNEDRIDVQLNTLNQHLENQREKLKLIRDRHMIAGRTSLVKATEGRVKALEERVQIKSHELESHRKLRHGYEEICLALIHIEGAG